MLYQLAKRVLFCMDPETAHSVIMSNLDWAVNLVGHARSGGRSDRSDGFAFPEHDRFGSRYGQER